MLEISGVKMNEFKGETVCKMERRYGSFARFIRIPENVNLETIKAEVKHGVLTVTLMKEKKPGSEGKTVEIQWWRPWHDKARNEKVDRRRLADIEHRTIETS
mmetsp:Transcript_3451/g.8909  ORF Transcript_3451/g.8909 Transcript_3451/m.8909 type:complete len:102 (-) Transcript_3451:1607-1912(-)